jgi:hypothetical protein
MLIYVRRDGKPSQPPAAPQVPALAKKAIDVLEDDLHARALVFDEQCAAIVLRLPHAHLAST